MRHSAHRLSKYINLSVARLGHCLKKISIDSLCSFIMLRTAYLGHHLMLHVAISGGSHQHWRRHIPITRYRKIRCNVRWMGQRCRRCGCSGRNRCRGCQYIVDVIWCDRFNFLTRTRMCDERFGRILGKGNINSVEINRCYVFLFTHLFEFHLRVHRRRFFAVLSLRTHTVTS
jgi:hypothetical protein